MNGRRRYSGSGKIESRSSRYRRLGRSSREVVVVYLGRAGGRRAGPKIAIWPTIPAELLIGRERMDSFHERQVGEDGVGFVQLAELAKVIGVTWP